MHHALWNSITDTSPEPTHPSEAKVNFHFTLLDSLLQQECLDALADDQCVGCSITMPHKLTLMNQVNELSQEASIIGAINTIYVRRDAVTGARRLIGANTDCIGIREAFLRSFTITDSNLTFEQRVRGRTALVIGAGGAARAAIYALWKFFDIRLVYLVNRFEHEAEEVTISMRRNECKVELKYVNNVEEVRASDFESPVMVVGTVPDIPARTVQEVMMKELVEEVLCRRRASDAWLLDMCYHPDPITSLMKMARKQGWQTVSGIEALKYQGVKQFELWSGRKVEQATVAELSGVIDDAMLRRTH